MSIVAAIRPHATRIFRALLVFVLVFGTSLHAELRFAYGDDEPGAAGAEGSSEPSAPVTPETPETPSTPQPPAAPQLTDIVVYESSPGSSGWSPVQGANATGEGAEITLSVGGGGHELAAIPVYDGKYPSGYPYSALPSISATDAVKWEVTGEPAGCIGSSVKDGILTVSATSAGRAKITCASADKPGLKAVLAAMASASGEGPGPGTDVPGEQDAAVAISSIKILNDQGAAFESDPALTFQKSQLPVKYQLQAEVAITNLEGKPLYNSKENGGLSEFTGGELADLAWSVSDPNVVSVSEGGLLTITGEGDFTVSCTAKVLSTTLQRSEEIHVIAGSPDDAGDIQGASHPQESLTITAPNVSASPSDPGDSGYEDESESAGGDGSSFGIHKSYSVAELEDLGRQGATQMETRSFAMTNSSGALSIEGQGLSLLGLLEHAFDQAGAKLSDAPIESVSFIDYRGVRTTIDWNFLKGASAMVALKSRVQVENSSPDGEGADGADGQGDAASQDEEAQGLLDNTRFRVLFDAATGTFDSDALRWINTIELNMRTVDTDRLAVGVSYVPVPMGVEAELVASPNHNINGRWDCQWEQSRDRGLNWEKIPGATSQSLRVLTSSGTVGTLYRVTIDNSTSLFAGADTEHLTATSEPVELQAATGFSVILSYNPPRAGDLAIFRSGIYEYSGNAANLEYVWEWSEDGGASWSVVKGESKPTLKIPTEPVSSEGSSEGGGGGSTPNLIYIRVRVITPSDEVRVSNVQPLTVHVGDADTGPDGVDDDGRADGEDLPAGADSQEPNDTPGDSSQTTSAPSASTVPEMTPINSITFEDSAAPAAALDPTSSSNTPTTPREVSEISEVYVNEEVTERINEQLEQRNASVPGARWTSLRSLEPSAEEIQRVLEGNPIAPFILPFALGLLAVGALEKFLTFRAQVR